MLMLQSFHPRQGVQADSDMGLEHDTCQQVSESALSGLLRHFLQLEVEGI